MVVDKTANFYAFIGNLYVQNIQNMPLSIVPGG